MGLSLRHLRLRLGHQVPMNHCNMSARGSIEEALSAQCTGSCDKCGPSHSPHSGWISALGPRLLAITDQPKDQPKTVTCRPTHGWQEADQTLSYGIVSVGRSGHGSKRSSESEAALSQVEL